VVPGQQPGVPEKQAQEVPAAVAPKADLERYTKPESIWTALLTGHVKLVKMSWLIAHADAGGILPHRQALPDEAVISVDELKRMYGDGNKDDVLPIIAISFCWDTPAHPDPTGKQLATVAAMLKREQAKYAKANNSFGGFMDMGVFWVRPHALHRPPLASACAHCPRSDAHSRPLAPGLAGHPPEEPKAVDARMHEEGPDAG